MANLDSLLTLGLGGAIVGTGYYLYKNGYLKDFIHSTGNGGNGNGTSPPPPTTTPTPPPGTTGTYTFWVKKKMQCRDNHLSFSFLVSQGVRVLNYKLYNDGKIYVQTCGAPSPLMILVAIDSADAGSASILSNLGFTQYFAPPSEPNPTVPIPNPPANSNLAMTMAYVGQSENHRAYKVFRHYR